MKRAAIYLIIGVTVILFTLSLLKETGVIRIEWKTLLLLLSAFAPVTKWIADKLGMSTSERIEEIKQKYEQEIRQEQQLQDTINRQVETHREAIGRETEEVKAIDRQLDALKKKREELLKQDVRELSDEERKNLFNEAYG